MDIVARLFVALVIFGIGASMGRLAARPADADILCINDHTYFVDNMRVIEFSEGKAALVEMTVRRYQVGLYDIPPAATETASFAIRADILQRLFELSGTARNSTN